MSTLNLNFTNVEELLLSSNPLCQKLPRHKETFLQWKFAYMNPTLRSLRKKIVLDFLKSLTDEDVDVISKHFGSAVTIDTKVDYKIVTHLQFPIEEAEKALNSLDPSGNMISYRNGDTLYISLWR